MLAFAGDVYAGMEATTTFGERDFTHAQKVLRILSGLYGVLRPLDLMQPYRLEMGTKLRTARGSNLYEFWGDEITERLHDDIASSPGAKVLVNLASIEYFGSVRPSGLGAEVVSPSFLDSASGEDFKVVSFFAKRARGAMAGWIIRERVASPRALRGFDGCGYRWSAARSTDAHPVFLRVGGSARH